MSAETPPTKYLDRSVAQHWRDNEIAAQDRIREDAKRPLGENLARAIALSALTLELRESLQRSIARKSA